MVKTLVSIAGAALLAGISGCSTPPPAQEVRSVDSVKVLLDKAIQDDVVMPVHSVSADVKAIPAQMNGDRITIRSYVGDASNLLSRLAKARGMTFKVNGPEPRLPLLVTVDVDSVTFEDLLRQVSFQFGQRANLVLGDGRIEIRYRGQP
jgi:defect-in-organelle-trafficking protein DotD